MSRDSHLAAVLSPCVLALLLCAPVRAQIVVAPGFQSSLVASGIPGSRHQVAVEASGTIWVGEEGLTPGFGPGAMHRVVSGAVTPNVIPFLACPGQMVRHPADGLVYFVHHWSGALDHNHLDRIEANGTATLLIDVLWGVGHGLTLSDSGVFHLGKSSSPFAGPATIVQIPNPPGSATELPWHPGVADNGHLAWAGGNSALVASALPGPGTVTRVEPGQPSQTVFTHVPQAPGNRVTVRSLVRNPFGGGWLASVVETDAATGIVSGSVHFVGPGGPFVLASGSALLAPGDFAINEDGAGGLLLVEAGALHRIVASTPPVAPGTLAAPTTATQGTPVFVTVAGRPLSIAPFVLAADLPIGPPMFPGGTFPIPPYGVAHTSLGLLPTFVVLEDGIPVFASSPTLAGFLPASGSRTLGYLVPPITTPVTVVLEAYILDAAAPNGLVWITNPVFLTLTP